MHVDPFVLLLAVHVLAASLWLGAAALMTLYILPAIRQTGAAGATLMTELVRRGFPKFMAAVGGVTILAGLWLYWLWAESVGANGIHGAGGILLLLGALAGIASAIIGGAILGRGSEQLAALAAEPADAGREARVAALHQRMASASILVLGLLVLALLLMMLGRSA